MAKKNLIILGEMKAQCACGGWSYQGVMPEAVKAIARVHDSHRWACPLEGKKKKNEKNIRS